MVHQSGNLWQIVTGSIHVALTWFDFKKKKKQGKGFFGGRWAFFLGGGQIFFVFGCPASVSQVLELKTFAIMPR